MDVDVDVDVVEKESIPIVKSPFYPPPLVLLGTADEAQAPPPDASTSSRR